MNFSRMLVKPKIALVGKPAVLLSVGMAKNARKIYALPSIKYSLDGDSLMLLLLQSKLAARNHVGGRAVKTLRGFHQGFGKRWVRMHRFGDVPRRGAHLDGEHALADQLAGASADNTHAEDAFTVGLDDELGQAVRAVESERAA